MLGCLNPNVADPVRISRTMPEGPILKGLFTDFPDIAFSDPSCTRNFWHVRNRKLYEQHVIATVPPEARLFLIFRILHLGTLGTSMLDDSRQWGSIASKEQLMIFDASAGDTIGKIAKFLNVSTDMNPDSYPRLFDKSKLASHGTHAQIVRHNLLMIIVAATASLLLLVALVLLFRAGQSMSKSLGRWSSEKSKGKFPNLMAAHAALNASRAAVRGAVET